jgi:hypothetical protein
MILSKRLDPKTLLANSMKRAGDDGFVPPEPGTADDFFNKRSH